jgi:hypothetical protein
MLTCWLAEPASTCRNVAGLAKGEAEQLLPAAFQVEAIAAGARCGASCGSGEIAQAATAPITLSIDEDGTDGVIGRQAENLASSAADDCAVLRKPALVQFVGLDSGGRESPEGQVGSEGVQTASTLL